MKQQGYTLIWVTTITALVVLAGVPFTAPAAASPLPFTIVALPDTQNYSQSYPQIFTSQTQWILSNQASQNIAFVAHEGDITNNGTARNGPTPPTPCTC